MLLQRKVQPVAPPPGECEHHHARDQEAPDDRHVRRHHTNLKMDADPGEAPGEYDYRIQKDVERGQPHTHQHRSAALAASALTRSEGAISICRPRRPPFTRMVA